MWHREETWLASLAEVDTDRKQIVNIISVNFKQAHQE